jgi:hypothetical protein
MTIKARVTVVMAAVCRGSRVWTGKRHNEVIMHMHEIGEVMPVLGEEQGFLLSDGTFATRGRAARVAYEAGQVDRLKKELSSEDLY